MGSMSCRSCCVGGARGDDERTLFKSVLHFVDGDGGVDCLDGDCLPPPRFQLVASLPVACLAQCQPIFCVDPPPRTACIHDEFQLFGRVTVTTWNPDAGKDEAALVKIMAARSAVAICNDDSVQHIPTNTARNKYTSAHIKPGSSLSIFSREKVQHLETQAVCKVVP